MIMDGEVPWEFDTEPVDGPGPPVLDGPLAVFEAGLTDGLDPLGGSGESLSSFLCKEGIGVR